MPKTLNPNFKIFEDKLKDFPDIKDEVQKIIGSETDFKPPIKIKKEGHSVEDTRKLLEYNAIANYFGGKIPSDLKEQWEKLKNNQKPTDYEQIKGELGKWTSTFPNLEPTVVKIKYDQLPATELSEAEKEAIREYQAVKNERDVLKGKVNELEKRPTSEELTQTNSKLKEWTDKFGDKKPEEVLAKYNEPKGTNVEGLPTDWKDKLSKLKDLEDKLEKEPKEPNIIALKNSLLGEENKNLWELVNTKLIKIIQEVVPKAEKIPK